MTDKLTALAEHVEGLVAPRGSFLNAGLVVHRKGELLLRCAAGPLRPGGEGAFTATTPLRFASVSKAVTARAALALARRGVLDLDRPVSAYLRGILPAHVTARALMAHISGITDRAGYLIDRHETLSAFIQRNHTAILSEPGRFGYSNLGSIVLGAVIERALGQRFDEAVMTLVLEPLGIEGRFAWEGMSAVARAKAGPAVRLVADDFVAQIDGAVPLEGLFDRHGQRVDLSAYAPGEDTGLFAPHAGLRMSLDDAARLAAAFADDSQDTLTQITPLWRHDPQTDNGDAVDGLFSAYGAGLQLHPPSEWFSQPLVGHFGNAYGIACGVWADRARGASFAFTLNGLPEHRSAEDRESFYSTRERALFSAIDHALL